MLQGNPKQHQQFGGSPSEWTHQFVRGSRDATARTLTLEDVWMLLFPSTQNEKPGFSCEQQTVSTAVDGDGRSTPRNNKGARPSSQDCSEKLLFVCTSCATQAIILGLQVDGLGLHVLEPAHEHVDQPPPK